MEIVYEVVSGCQECGKWNMPVIRLGEPYADGSATTWICAECLKKALSIIGEASIKLPEKLSKIKIEDIIAMNEDERSKTLLSHALGIKEDYHGNN